MHLGGKCKISWSNDDLERFFNVFKSAMVHLARQEEAHMVKLVMMVVPMLTDYSFGDPRDMTNQEAESVIIQQKLWRLIGGPQVLI